MIRIIKPYGAINECLLRRAYEEDGKFFIRDNGWNRYQVQKDEYLRCKGLLKNGK